MTSLHQQEKASRALAEVRGLSGGRRAARLLVERLKTEDYLGGGAERQVFGLDGERVAAFFPKANAYPEDMPRMMKAYYYSGKLAHLLMPENFPDVHLAGSEPPVIIADRINVAEPTDSHDRYKFRRQLERMGLAEAVDYNSPNFAKDEKGNVVYLDIITPEKLLTPEFREYCAVLDDDVFAKVKGLQAKIIQNLVD